MVRRMNCGAIAVTGAVVVAVAVGGAEQRGFRVSLCVAGALDERLVGQLRVLVCG